MLVVETVESNLFLPSNEEVSLKTLSAIAGGAVCNLYWQISDVQYDNITL